MKLDPLERRVLREHAAELFVTHIRSTAVPDNNAADPRPGLAKYRIAIETKRADNSIIDIPEFLVDAIPTDKHESAKQAVRIGIKVLDKLADIHGLTLGDFVDDLRSNLPE